MSKRRRFSIFFFISMMAFLCSTRLIQYHFHSDDSCETISKSSRSNPINNLVEEEIHSVASLSFSFVVLAKSHLLVHSNRSNFHASLKQEVIAPPPEPC